MKYANDKTIFKYLDPTSNDMFSDFSGEEMNELLFHLNKYYLEYRNYLGLDSSVTFGIEIEIEHFKCRIDEFYEFQLLINKVVGNDKWETKNDTSLYNYNPIDNKIIFGREITSDVLFDCGKSWIDIKNVCDVASLYGVIGGKCGAHVHTGAHILGDSSLYWYRFLKLWSIYENVIFRFLYGEYLNYRPVMMEKTRPCALFFNSKLDKIYQGLDNGLIYLLNVLNEGNDLFSKELKYYGVSLWHMLCDDNYDFYKDYNVFNKYCTVECRAGNGTFDPIIWQNIINFIIKLLLYCKSPNFNDDILDSRRIKVEPLFGNISKYAEIYFDQAVELCDMIFDNNLDKVYFLRQYLKSFEVADKPFVKAKKFTMNNMK